MGDDINYGEIFGVETATTEDSTPTEETSEGAEEQEITDPADDTDTSETDTDEGEPVQSAAENSRYAAARRKAEAERDAAVAKAKEEAAKETQKAIDGVFADMGLYDPYNKKPITTKAEYDAYKQRLDIERKAKVAKASGMSEKEFDDFVAELPEVKAAREAQARAEAQEKAAQAAQAKVKIDEQLSEIAMFDPSVKTLDDLKKMDNYDEFYSAVKRGNSLVDAYKLVNFDKLTTQAASGAKQAALNSISGKSHLEKTSGRGTGAMAVPAEIVEQYKMFNPKATDAEIQKHYNKYAKK